MNVHCVLSSESPHRGDSIECTQYTIFNIKKEKSSLIILSLPLWDFIKGLKNEFETAVVNEPSVFEPLKFYCTVCLMRKVYTVTRMSRYRQYTILRRLIWACTICLCHYYGTLGKHGLVTRFNIIFFLFFFCFVVLRPR